jgi:hypothetical protein
MSPIGGGGVKSWLKHIAQAYDRAAIVIAIVMSAVSLALLALALFMH